MSEFKNIERALDRDSHPKYPTRQEMRDQIDFARRVAKSALVFIRAQEKWDHEDRRVGVDMYDSAPGRTRSAAARLQGAALALAALEREAEQMNGGGR